MKRLNITVLALLFSGGLASAQQTGNVSISGTVKGVSTGKIYLQKFNNKMFFSIDSAELKNGSFQFNKSLELPELYGLTLNKNKSPLYVFLESGKISADIDTTAYYSASVVSGS